MWLGGDHRLRPEVASGLSPYRVAAGPRSSVPLGSCTASSPSQRSWDAMGRALEAWRDDASDASAEGIRERLRAFAGLAPDAPIVLTPSGTDAIYVVSTLALCGASRVHHVVVGASELGGGTVDASEGKSFTGLPPRGALALGAPVEGLGGRCSAEPIYLRGPLGARLDSDEVDRAVEARVRASAAPGTTVVLHLVAHSKTGLRAPTTATASSLHSELGSRLLVLVDAAQGRLAPHDIRQALDLGFAVLFTGSKFYSGPPFSGALFLPSRLAGDPGALPPGLENWLTAADLPGHWTRARRSLSGVVNQGLLLRWEGALAEIEAYHAIDARRRAGVYHTFAGAIHEVIGPAASLTLDGPLPPVHSLVTGLGAYPSVYGFQVQGPKGVLGAAELKRLHASLDTDREAVDSALAGAYHLGQPVVLGPPHPHAPAVLRLALGGRLVTDLALTPDCGGLWMRTTLGKVRDKIDALLARGGGAP
jgi:selenocysteine lyase/cysteine desulfurase